MKTSDFDDQYWFETVLRGACRFELEDWAENYENFEDDDLNVSLLFLQLDLAYAVYKKASKLPFNFLLILLFETTPRVG